MADFRGPYRDGVITRTRLYLWPIFKAIPWPIFGALIAMGSSLVRGHTHGRFSGTLSRWGHHSYEAIPMADF
jgi:hypothetical protein